MHSNVMVTDNFFGGGIPVAILPHILVPSFLDLSLCYVDLLYRHADPAWFRHSRLKPCHTKYPFEFRALTMF